MGVIEDTVLGSRFIVFKSSYIEVYSGIEFPKHDFQFNYDTNCRIYVIILHHSGLSYNMF